MPGLLLDLSLLQPSLFAFFIGEDTAGLLGILTIKQQQS